MDLDQQPTRPTNVHLFQSLEGGGSKAETAQRLKDDFAARAMQVGYDPMETKSFTDALYHEAGAARMRQLLNLTDSDTFAHRCTVIAKQTEVQVPLRHDLEADRHKRVKASWQTSQNRASSLQTESLTIEPGTFLILMKDMYFPCLQPPVHDKSGVVILDGDEAMAFVRDISTKSKNTDVDRPGGLLSARQFAMPKAPFTS